MIPLANHLWQSTIFAAVVALLALLLRNNRPQTRYWLWLAASVKFLVPFSLLVSAGSLIEWRTAPAMPIAIEQIAQPFEPLPQLPVLPVAEAAPPSVWWAGLWICGCAALLAFWLVRWRGMRVQLDAFNLFNSDYLYIQNNVNGTNVYFRDFGRSFQISGRLAF